MKIGTKPPPPYNIFLGKVKSGVLTLHINVTTVMFFAFFLLFFISPHNSTRFHLLKNMHYAIVLLHFPHENVMRWLTTVFFLFFHKSLWVCFDPNTKMLEGIIWCNHILFTSTFCVMIDDGSYDSPW